MQKKFVYELLPGCYIILCNILIDLLISLKFIKRLDIIIKYEFILK